MVTVEADVVDYIPSSAKHLRVVLHALDRALNDGRHAAVTDARRPMQAAPTLAPPLHKMSEMFRRRSMIAVISDLYEEPEAVVSAINNLRGRGNDIMVFHLLDPTELEFPFADSSNFIDLETGEKMPVIPEYLRKQYREVVREHVASLGRLLRDQRVDYALFNTSQPLDNALFTYLATRERLRRTR
jgi:hypothetical protein